MKKNLNRITALFLVCACLLSMSAFAADIAPMRASDYIDRYDAYITANGNGEITINFSVYAKSKMTEVGATTIYLYEKNGNTTTRVATFSYTNSTYKSAMMGYNASFKIGSITYSGVAGRQYYAVVNFKAENSTGSDTRSKTTTTITAT